MTAAASRTTNAAARRARPLLLLGLTLARRGILPVASIVICILTALGAAVLGATFAARGPQAPAHDVPLVASSALAWGGGFLLAFAVAAHALIRDRKDGIRSLFVARTTSLRGYLLGRVGGLALLVAILVGGGTLLCGLVTMAFASSAAVLPRILHATLAGVAYACAFGFVVAPVAFAALGARSRFGGYLFLIGIVTIPELVVTALGASLPSSIADVLSIPSALAAFRTSLAPGSVDLYRTARAVVAMGFMVTFVMFLVRRDAILVDHPEADT